jgi:hypothetical protein
MTDAFDNFKGMEQPQENWLKLPHQIIELMHAMSESELKVVLYIIRHTWGYKDEIKRISIDEFCNGRKRVNGTRIDNGTGMSLNAVRDGIDRAVAHKLIVIETDKSDAARIKNYYRISSPDDFLDKEQETDQGIKFCTPEDQNLIPGGSKSDPRTKKETIEKNYRERAEFDSAPIPPQDVILLSKKQTSFDCPFCGKSQSVNLKEPRCVECNCEIDFKLAGSDGLQSLKKFPPETNMAKYLRDTSSKNPMVAYRWVEFASKKERDDWEQLEKQWGAGMKATIDWAIEKKIPRAKIVHSITTALDRHGLFENKQVVPARSSEMSPAGLSRQEEIRRQQQEQAEWFRQNSK